MGRGPKPTRGTAKPAVSRKSPKNEGSRVHDLEKRLAEALEREAGALTREAEAQAQRIATAEILRVISHSPNDIQPVFEAIVRNAVQLCDAVESRAFLFDGRLIHFIAEYHTPVLRDMAGQLEAWRQRFPMPPTRETISGRAILDRAVIHVPDIEQDPDFPRGARAVARAMGYGSILHVPMLRDGNPIGTINVARTSGGFSDTQIELLKTFADQAVIAVENVRLFKKLEERNRALTEAHTQVTEALEQQSATSEVLRAISGSLADVQPVLDIIALNAARVCGARDGAVLLKDEADLCVASHHGPLGFAMHNRQTRIPIGRDWVAGRAVLEKRAIQVEDLLAAGDEYPRGLEMARIDGHRTTLATPLLREGEPIGILLVRRGEVRLFTPRQMALLETFAAQAVIAIENVRLFMELQASNRGLTTALDTQTATSDILRVISSSPTDVQPVFETIVRNARRLCDADSCSVFMYGGDLIRLESIDNATAEGADAIRRAYPLPPSRGHATGRAILTGRPVHISDVRDDPEYELHGILGAGLRSIVAVPLLREGIAIGTITLHTWATPRPFSERQIDLVKTFADQAVIAIENVRLFTELQEKNRALTDAHTQVSEALEQQTATAEVLRVISGSPTDLQPVFDSMLQSAVRLLSGFGGAILLYDGSALQLGAVTGGRPQSGAEDWFRSIYPLPLDPETPIGIAILERRMIQLPDTEESPSQITREVARGFQFRALVTVPMLREGSAIGTISITRAAPGEFSERQVEVLQTFADQAVIAIENVRLFKELEASNREIADKSRQLEVASQHKSEFLANMSHELRTPLNAIIGFSEVLSEKMFGELNEKQEEYSKDIHASGQHLLSLINDILDLSKIEAGRMELELSDFHLPTALDSALTLVRERAGRRSIALHLSVDERPGHIQADERKVRQVVLNLLSNAIKFTPEGGRIEVLAAPKGGFVEVSVIDTGVGIAPEDQEAVFEEFRQVGTADKKVEGTGLGLTLCRKFVELHGGKIWVKSQVGVGSTFTFTIPVRRGE